MLDILFHGVCPSGGMHHPGGPEPGAADSALQKVRPPGTHRRSGPLSVRRRRNRTENLKKIWECKTSPSIFVSNKYNEERRSAMTFYQWIRECLQREAVRTEPDSRGVLQKVLAEMEKWKKKE